MKFDDSVPIYLQIKEEIENAIITNSIQEEESLPSIRFLAQQYRLNPQTISNAISELMNEGIIYKKRGIGMFVEKGAKAKLKKKKKQEFRNDDLIKIVHKSKSLGISKEDLIEKIKSLYEGGNK